MTTNMSHVDLEDAIVDRLAAHELLTGRTVAVTSPFMDVNELPAPPIALVNVYDETRRQEGNAIGVPLTVKVDVTVHVMIVASWLRARGDSAGAHEMIAAIKDQLMGWEPSNLSDVKRPLALESSAIYDHDEDRRLLFWMTEWSTMIIVREPR